MLPHFAAIEKKIDDKFDSIKERLENVEQTTKAGEDKAKEYAKKIEANEKALDKQEKRLVCLDKAFRKFHRRDHNEYVFYLTCLQLVQGV